MDYLDKLTMDEHRTLLRVARQLTAQHDVARLYEIILETACDITGADGGTFYLAEGYGRDLHLEFTIVHNRSLGLRLGGTSGKNLRYPPVLLYQDGQPNHRHVASHAGLTGELVNIADLYAQADFSFTGTRDFDQRFGYRTQSILTLPLKAVDGELVAVLQLLNATNAQGEVTAFEPSCETVVRALADFAAIAVQQQRAVHDQKELLVSLAGEPNSQQLLERIVIEAQAITHADGGTLYLYKDDEQSPRLEFALLRNPRLGISMGDKQDKIDLPPIPLYRQDGQENHHHVAASAALSRRTINIADAYNNTDYDFSGTHAFDQANGYRSVSLLTIPLLNHDNDVIGVLQLVNAQQPNSGAIIPFSDFVLPLVKALARYAAIVLNNQLLVDELKTLLDAFIKVIAAAIDAKSPHTSRHCQRVPQLTELIAQAACEDDQTFADFQLTDDEWYELHVAAWMHDCGKLSTPDSVLDKATKLHTLYDRIQAIEGRFAALRQQYQVTYWQALHAGEDQADAEAVLAAKLQQLDDDLAFVRAANQGGEFMSESDQARIQQIANRQWQNADGHQQSLLTADEVQNLCIERGTLTSAERKVISQHVDVSIRMLESLPFPRKLRRVPEYAGAHHEKMDGSGYPRGLTRDEMLIPARMMAIADIFEALTAKDRPYKQPMKMSQALSILQSMRNANHIDAELYELFLRKRVWEIYAKAELAPEQLDVEDVTVYA